VPLAIGNDGFESRDREQTKNEIAAQGFNRSQRFCGGASLGLRLDSKRRGGFEIGFRQIIKIDGSKGGLAPSSDQFVDALTIGPMA
jgi:hypothetical protein